MQQICFSEHKMTTARQRNRDKHQIPMSHAWPSSHDTIGQTWLRGVTPQGLITYVKVILSLFDLVNHHGSHGLDIPSLCFTGLALIVSRPSNLGRANPIAWLTPTSLKHFPASASLSPLLRPLLNPWRKPWGPSPHPTKCSKNCWCWW